MDILCSIVRKDYHQCCQYTHSLSLPNDSKSISILTLRQSVAMRGLRSKDPIGLNYEHLTNVRFIEDRCLFLSSIFNSYSRNLACMKLVRAAVTAERKLRVVGSPPTAFPLDIWCNNLQEEVASFDNNAGFLSKRCSNTAQLLSETLDFKTKRDQEIQTASTYELTHLTLDDSATMQVITVITLVYLSSTSIAVRQC